QLDEEWALSREKGRHIHSQARGAQVPGDRLSGKPFGPKKFVGDGQVYADALGLSFFLKSHSYPLKST
ncbi:MAG: hypothetical protein PHF12_02140, partial [Candidatus Omnitrophica bacterium]|nr:hypothetical protein [Candidatus Omnitrophota bacterium]